MTEITGCQKSRPIATISGVLPLTWNMARKALPAPVLYRYEYNLARLMWTPLNVYTAMNRPRSGTKP